MQNVEVVSSSAPSFLVALLTQVPFCKASGVFFPRRSESISIVFNFYDKKAKRKYSEQAKNILMSNVQISKILL